MGGPTACGTQVATSAVAHEPTAAPVMAAPRRPGDAQPTPRGGIMRRQRARQEGIAPLRCIDLGVHAAVRHLAPRLGGGRLSVTRVALALVMIHVVITVA